MSTKGSSPRTTRPITKLLLELLAAAGTGTVDFYVMLHDLRFHRGAYLGGGHGYVKELQRLQNERAAKLVLKRLRERGYIRAQKLGRRLMVTLTTKGEQTTLAARLRVAPLRADRLYTVVIFDIPQSQNQTRRQFRWLLRQGGFIKLQQSVWVSRADAYQVLAAFTKRLRLEPWVNVFYARSFLNLPRRVMV